MVQQGGRQQGVIDDALNKKCQKLEREKKGAIVRIWKEKVRAVKKFPYSFGQVIIGPAAKSFKISPIPKRVPNLTMSIRLGDMSLKEEALKAK
ncbi:UNVERIFIED_CONTAM: hypothetical protein Sindi_2460700 [Sesamum indicum]